MSAICNQRSRFGACGRAREHGGVHAVQVGEDCWYAWRSVKGHAKPIGYVRLKDLLELQYEHEESTA